MLAFQAAGLEQLYPGAGASSLPSALYLATHPHSAVPRLRDVIGARRAMYSVFHRVVHPLAALASDGRFGA